MYRLQRIISELSAAFWLLCCSFCERFVGFEPFEVIPIGPDNETMFYSGAQYVVIGAADDFMETSIGTVRIVETDSHPVTDIQEEHFVIELSPIYLRWNHEE